MDDHLVTLQEIRVRVGFVDQDVQAGSSHLPAGRTEYENSFWNSAGKSAPTCLGSPRATTLGLRVDMVVLGECTARLEMY